MFISTASQKNMLKLEKIEDMVTKYTLYRTHREPQLPFYKVKNKNLLQTVYYDPIFININKWQQR